MASASSLEKDATDTTNLLERSEVVERAPEEDHQEAEQDDQEETHNNEDPPTVEDGASRGTLSMSLGVVAPVCLSMFSTLLYLRIGYIVGNAGLAVALAMLVVAYAILAITVSSISAISTNGEVKGGGVYFMISRTLGPDFGASVGFLFWVANLVGSALFCTGCAEGLEQAAWVLFDGTLPIESSYWRGIAWTTMIHLFNLLICLMGGRLFGKMVIFLLLAVSFTYGLVFYAFVGTQNNSMVYNDTMVNCTVNCTEKLVTGHFSGLLNDNISAVELLINNTWPDIQRDCEDAELPVTLQTLFAVLFSGVTGIMAGANLSGDLKNPSHAIPVGTTIACTVTFGCYAIFFVLTAATCDRALLYHDCQYMAAFNDLSTYTVMIGVLLTTLCASLSCLIGGSRILESVCKDLQFFPLNHIYAFNRWNNPIGSVLVSWLVVEIFLFIGSLNKISKVCSVLYLLAYAAVNGACCILGAANPTNFRPGSRVHHWALSLIGIGCCVIASFLMSWVSTLVAWITCIILYLGLAKMEPRDKDRNWGSVSQALMFHQVRKYLLILDPRKSHVKYWRPQILLLISNPRKSCAIIEFTNALKKGGLFMLGHVKIGDLENIQDEDPIIGEIGNWYSLIDHLNIKAFVELTMCQTLRVGIQNLARLTGIGALKPHTVMLGLPLEDDENVRDDFASGNRASEQLNEVFPPSPKNAPMDATQFVTILEDLLKLKKNFLLFRNFQKLDYGDWFRSGTFRTLTRNNSIVYCDVWLVDFLGPMNDSTFEDTISEFILQMAFIVSKVKKWQKLTFRIIVRVSDAESEANKEVELRVKRKLAELRIKGIVLLMSMVPPTPSSEETPDFERIETIPDSYINFMQNKIVEQSANTAISFVYLRKPPIHESASGKKRFLQLLDILTKDMPPTLLIHGLYSVISKEL